MGSPYPTGQFIALSNVIQVSMGMKNVKRTAHKELTVLLTDERTNNTCANLAWQIPFWFFNACCLAQGLRLVEGQLVWVGCAVLVAGLPV